MLGGGGGGAPGGMPGGMAGGAPPSPMGDPAMMLQQLMRHSGKKGPRGKKRGKKKK
jgi:hypothetical protein